MIQNLVWATAYNLVALPIARVRWGIDLPMSVGAIAMSASTIIVAANAQLLRGLNCNVRRSGWPSRLWYSDGLHPMLHPEIQRAAVRVFFARFPRGGAFLRKAAK